jgi:cytochrome c-type biogenesis protein CcmH
MTLLLELVAVAALILLPLGTAALYIALGSPFLPDQPLAARLADARGNPSIDTLVTQVEDHLARQPEDGRGWEVIAPVYLRMGRSEDAVRAYEAALRLLGPDVNRLTSYGEAQVFAQGGIVSADARAAFEKALALEPSSAKARFYLARAAEQDGDVDRARAGYQALLASSPADAPWRPVVEQELARLNGPADAPGSGREQIVGMVEGLAARLDAQGGSGDEWARLLRSYMVLGEHDKAQVALRKARRALERDQAGLRSVDATAQELQLTSSKP